MADEAQPANYISLVIGKTEELCHIFREKHRQERAASIFWNHTIKRNKTEDTENRCFSMLLPGDET